MTRAEGFGPVWDAHSRVLILGSFPSVKSRAVRFYYGNPQNRFWRTVCDFFGTEVPETPEGKGKFCLDNGIALWDVVLSCEIVGSADSSIRNAEIADLPALLKESGIPAILCNGGTAYGLLGKHFPALLACAKRLPSTSPANPRFSAEEWKNALEEIFGRGKRGEFSQSS